MSKRKKLLLIAAGVVVGVIGFFVVGVAVAIVGTGIANGETNH